MRKPQHPSAFADIAPILDAALAAGGARYRPRDDNGKATPQAATRFRARAYAFRRALQHLQEKEGAGLITVTTPYDSMVLRLDPSDPTVVLINKADTLGELMGFDGEPLVIGPRGVQEERDDPLLDQALKQAKELGI